MAEMPARAARGDAPGKVEYEAAVFLVKPTDVTRSSHLRWHADPNRGDPRASNPAPRKTQVRVKEICVSDVCLHPPLV